MAASESTELGALRDLQRWRASGAGTMLATVVRSYGSSPRPPGSIAGFSSTGVVTGSVSGGCVEDDLCRRFCEGDITRAAIVRYGGTEARRFGLPCGGELELLLEPDPDPSGLATLQSGLARRAVMVREVDIEQGTSWVRAGTTGDEFHYDGRRLRCVYGPRWRLLLIGAGTLSQALANIAAGLDYEVLICDPRSEYEASWTACGVRLYREMPDDVVRLIKPDVRTAVIALAHDPKIDDLALMVALESPAFYVGALGSSVNNARRRERLATLGLPPAALARLHGPVGLAIGSRTPAEIAVAIAADLILERATEAGRRPAVSPTSGRATG